MTIPSIKAICATGPHIEGLIRFSYEEHIATRETHQRAEFELLSRVHEGTPKVGELPRMQQHPLAETILARQNEDNGRRLLTEVPIRFLGRTPESNLSARFEAFDTSSGRMMCCGDGEKAVRQDGTDGPLAVACKGPDACEYANSGTVNCKLHCRLKVQVDGSSDPLAVFEFQSSGINTYRTLSAKLAMLYAIYGNLRGLPLRLTSWTKSSSLSMYQPFYCANIELREGKTLADTASEADDPFKGIQSPAMDSLDAAMEQMARDNMFDLNGQETVVTTWTAASVIQAARGAKATSGAGPSIADSVGEIVKRVKAEISSPGQANTVLAGVAPTAVSIANAKMPVPADFPMDEHDISL